MRIVPLPAWKVEHRCVLCATWMTLGLASFDFLLACFPVKYGKGEAADAVFGRAMLQDPETEQQTPRTGVRQWE